MSKLTASIRAFKLVARDALRMNLINARLTNIGLLEANVRSIEDHVESHNKELTTLRYELEHSDKEHPEYKERVERSEKTIKEVEESNETLAKNIEEVNKEIDEEREGITKIEEGTTKVSRDRLNTLVETMIEQDAMNQVADVEVQSTD